jgi:hypothetical protein
MAPTQRLNAEFALKVAWEEDPTRLAHQVSTAKQWMRDHGMWGVIATRQYLTEQAIRDLEVQQQRAPHPAAAVARPAGRRGSEAVPAKSHKMISVQ